jgi:phenylacetate-CoA ligase
MNWRNPIIYALLYISGSKIPKYLKEIQRIEKLPEKELKEYQNRKLEKLLLHAWKNVPYYTKILEDSQVVIDGKVNLKNFNKIPILTKEIIRQNFDNLHTKKLGKGWKYNTSGGSTGEPVKFVQDNEYLDWEIANKIWYKIIAGQDIGEKELRFWGSERDLLEGKESLKIRLRNWLYNRKEFNTFKMSEEQMKNYVFEWNKYKPFWVEAYAQSIYEFAKFIKQNNLEIYPPKNGILTSAGTLYPEMKKLIEEVFKCPVYNRYGSREVGDMACGADKLRLSIWCHKLEILNNKNKDTDKLGKIIVTALNNYSMPLIRYDIGDIGVYNQFGYLDKIEGREMNVFKTEKGKTIPGEFFIHFIGVVYNNGAISKFQVLQKDYNKILIKVIINNKKDFKNSKKKIEDAIKKEMNNNCQIKWEFVKDIPPLKNGKYFYTISEIK